MTIVESIVSIIYIVLPIVSYRCTVVYTYSSTGTNTDTEGARARSYGTIAGALFGVG